MEGNRYGRKENLRICEMQQHRSKRGQADDRSVRSFCARKKYFHG